MTCTCVSDFEKKVLEKQPLKGKKILKAKLPVMLSFSPGKVQERLCITAEFEIEGVKTPKKVEVAYAFCPFCGKKAVEEEIVR